MFIYMAIKSAEIINGARAELVDRQILHQDYKYIAGNCDLFARVSNWLESVKDYLCNLNALSPKSTLKCQDHCKVSGNVSSDLKLNYIKSIYNTKLLY